MVKKACECASDNALSLGFAILALVAFSQDWERVGSALLAVAVLGLRRVRKILDKKLDK